MACVAVDILHWCLTAGWPLILVCPAVEVTGRVDLERLRNGLKMRPSDAPNLLGRTGLPVVPVSTLRSASSVSSLRVIASGLSLRITGSNPNWVTAIGAVGVVVAAARAIHVRFTACRTHRLRHFGFHLSFFGVELISVSF